MAWINNKSTPAGLKPWLVNVNVIVGGHGKEVPPGGGEAVEVRSKPVDNIYLDVEAAKALRDKLDSAIEDLEEVRVDGAFRPTVKDQTYDLDLIVEKVV